MQAKEAVVYCRVSTHQQANKGNGLSIQLQTCIEYCQKKGLNVIAVFSEIGSGDARQESKLPARHQAVVLAKQRKAVVVCTTGCRFSRETPSECPYWDFITDGKVIEAYLYI